MLSGEPARLTRVDSVLERARGVVNGLGADEQSTGRELLANIPAMVAATVPIGIDFLGSFKSPESPTPAAIPVKAGKIIAKT